MKQGASITYRIAAWLFVAGVLVQVFFAGMVVVARRWPWDNHVSLGHSLGLPLLVMLISMYLGRLPGSIKRLTWLLFAAYFLQADVIIFLRDSAPAVSALHPVLALVDFALGLAVAMQAQAWARQEAKAGALQLGLEPSAAD